ncbi:MAG: hypothetical protein QOC77_2796 [Thermoleophilaceae bacterium]|nr:hypothetical protein [Thermoleophilaceae bacterium]
MTLLADVAELPVLSAGGVTYRWSDVFLAARLRGEWDAVAESAAAPEAPSDDDALRRAGIAFRTERRLLAADELRDWLARHRLTLEDWNAYLRRRLGPGSRAQSEPPAGALWAEGACSGALERFAHALAARAAALAAEPDTEAGAPPADWFARMPARAEAAALGVPADDVPGRCAELWRGEAAYESLRAAVIESDAPKRALAAGSADWLRVDCEYVVAADESVAREAALLLREDGMPLVDVARAAGLEPVDGRPYVGEMPPELRTRAISAAPGDRIGPIAVDGGSLFVVMSVRGKVAPSMDDPEIRARAESAAVQKAVEREISGRVTWHEHG